MGASSGIKLGIREGMQELVYGDIGFSTALIDGMASKTFTR